MFWKNGKGLRDVPGSSKIALTAFLVLIGVAYLFGFGNIYLTYSPIDQEKGLSVTDIRIAFYGAREATKLETAIDGSMGEYIESDADLNTIKTWIKAGGPQEDFGTVKEIFDRSCNSCHSSDVELAGVALENYDQVKPLLKQDTGKSVSRLVSLSHTHLFGILPVLFILTFIFSFTAFSETFKKVIFSIAFFAAAADIASWWLAKAVGAAAPLVILAGGLLGISFVIFILASLYDIWLKKKA